MDFNIFFKDNIYILFGILIYTLLNGNNHKKYGSKIIVIYSLIFFFYLSNALNLYYMLGVFLFLFFIQFEFFIEDHYKCKILTNLVDKIVDFLYLLFFKYQFLLYLFFLYFFNKVTFSNLNCNSIFYLSISIFIYIYILLSISNNKFELNDFDTMLKKLEPQKFSSFDIIDDAKMNILIELEDKTYLYRNISYNFFSFWILIFKIRTMTNLIINHKERKMLENENRKTTLKEKILNIHYFIKRQIRGYSTLEMQLYRQIAVKDGYNEKIQRKIAEIVYSQVLFKNFKKYLKRNYDIVSSKRYKMFLINRYLTFAPVFLGNRKINNYYDLFGNHKVSDGDFFLYVLCLSGKLNSEDILTGTNEIDINLFINKYNYYLWYFNISNSELERSIKFFNKNRI